MKESTFIHTFQEAAEKVCPGNCTIKLKPNLYYELYLDQKLGFSINDPKNPKRGYSAFQVDFCLFEIVDQIVLPRIVIEFKTDINSHDILTYSTKAGKHKTIYPSLRYGLIASEIS